MSLQAALDFREYLKQNQQAEAEMRDLLARVGQVNFVTFARNHGFGFSEQEAAAAWQQVLSRGDLSELEKEMLARNNMAAGSQHDDADDLELSDLELEMVAGGGKYPCNTDQQRFEGDQANRSVDGTNGG